MSKGPNKVSQDALPAEPSDEPTFVTRRWKGVLDVYECQVCFRQFNLRDDVILHVVAHYPEAEQETALDRFMKEYKKE